MAQKKACAEYTVTKDIYDCDRMDKSKPIKDQKPSLSIRHNVDGSITVDLSPSVRITMEKKDWMFFIMHLLPELGIANI